MKKIAIVYWSGTGNTAQMAEAVAEAQALPVQRQTCSLPLTSPCPGQGL